jgi:hypothetical protein
VKGTQDFVDEYEGNLSFVECQGNRIFLTSMKETQDFVDECEGNLGSF